MSFSLSSVVLSSAEDSICGASSLHESKRVYMDFSALSHSSAEHLLPCCEGICEQFDSTVIITLLNATAFVDNCEQNAVSQGKWHALRGHDYVEQFA